MFGCVCFFLNLNLNCVTVVCGVKKRINEREREERETVLSDSRNR